jgi:hypothetical protein
LAPRSHERDGERICAAFVPGEAYQFDWSYEVVVMDDVTVKVKVAHVRLCHGRMFDARAYPPDKSEKAMQTRAGTSSAPVRRLGRVTDQQSRLPTARVRIAGRTGKPKLIKPPI